MTEITPTKAIPRRREATNSHPSVSIAAVMRPELGPPLEVAGQVEGCVPAAEECQDGSPLSSIGRRAPGSDRAWEELMPQGFYASYGKRAFNFLLLLAVLPFALLISFPIALINWVQFGQLRQILYCQPRVGQRGKVFPIFKFRTMREAPEDDFDSWSQGQDRLRVTPFGRLLRNTHLDELPQLLNILRGEMDFIGPRPEMVEIDRWACTHVPGFRKRNALPPGITGYAQITQGYAGKDAEAYAMKLSGDELYRERLSLTQDVVILVRTGLWMIRGRGWRFCPQRSEVGAASEASGSPIASAAAGTGNGIARTVSAEPDRRRENDKSADEISGTSAA